MDPKSINLFLVLDTEESEPEGSLLANPRSNGVTPSSQYDLLRFRWRKKKKRRREEKKKRRRGKKPRIWRYYGTRENIQRSKEAVALSRGFITIDSAFVISPRWNQRPSFPRAISQVRNLEKKIPRLAENFRSEEGTDREEDHDG